MSPIWVGGVAVPAVPLAQTTTLGSSQPTYDALVRPGYQRLDGLKESLPRIAADYWRNVRRFAE
ncbi:MAG: hypothetical protein AUI95_00415 [Crenarchaeota archaeon 13_1_40CM_3_52_4]|nr:MAG: hypothetical protein AUI95_00415 [Crenarchaeota archaeon 13_1_40CM_3_52_4]